MIINSVLLSGSLIFCIASLTGTLEWSKYFDMIHSEWRTSISSLCERKEEKIQRINIQKIRYLNYINYFLKALNDS